jgi:hypothetical protein
MMRSLNNRSGEGGRMDRPTSKFLIARSLQGNPLEWVGRIHGLRAVARVIGPQPGWFAAGWAGEAWIGHFMEQGRGVEVFTEAKVKVPFPILPDGVNPDSLKWDPFGPSPFNSILFVHRPDTRGEGEAALPSLPTLVEMSALDHPYWDYAILLSGERGDVEDDVQTLIYNFGPTWKVDLGENAYSVEARDAVLALV